jgi:trigger factor
VKTDLVLRAVGRKESIEVSDEEVQARAKELKAALSGQKVDRARLESVVYEDLYRGKVLTWLKENNSFELLEPGSLSQAEESEATEATEATEAEETPAAEATVDVTAESATDTDDTDDTEAAGQKGAAKKGKGKKAD